MYILNPNNVVIADDPLTLLNGPNGFKTSTTGLRALQHHQTIMQFTITGDISGQSDFKVRFTS